MDTLEMPVVEPVPRHRPAPRTSPRDRPPLGVRVFIGLLGIGASLATVALLLSDRAPGALRAMFGERARRLWARIDASERVQLPPGSELPPTDFLVHVVIWAVVAALVGLAIWTWRGLVVAALVLGAASLVLEAAQGRFAQTRVVELRDAVANLWGIGIGLVAAAVCFVVWSALAGLARITRRPGSAAMSER